MKWIVMKKNFVKTKTNFHAIILSSSFLKSISIIGKVSDYEILFFFINRS